MFRVTVTCDMLDGKTEVYEMAIGTELFELVRRKMIEVNKNRRADSITITRKAPLDYMARAVSGKAVN